MDWFKLRPQGCQTVKLIAKQRRHPIRQPLVGRPDLVGPSGCHRWCARSPTPRGSAAAHGLAPRPLLPPTVMGPHKRRVCQRSPPRLFPPYPRCAERLGLARQATRLWAKRPVLSCDDAGRDRHTRRHECHALGQALVISPHPVVLDRDQAPSGTGLHDWGIAPFRAWNAAWRRRPRARHRPPGGAVCRQLVAGTDGEPRGRDLRDPLPPQMGFDWGTLADDTGHHHAPGWGQGAPPPRLPIRLTRAFRPCTGLVWRLAKAPPFVPRARADGPVWPHRPDHAPTRRSRTLQSATAGLLIHLDAPGRGTERSARRPCAHGEGQEGCSVLPITIRCAVRQGDTALTFAAQRLAWAPCCPIRHQTTLTNAHTSIGAGRMRTIQGAPVHLSLGIAADFTPAEDTVCRYAEKAGRCLDPDDCAPDANGPHTRSAYAAGSLRQTESSVTALRL